MKICCLSDTHGNHRQVTIPKCDLIIFAGDMTNFGEEDILIDFNTWAGEQKVPFVCIAGNHDLTLERYPAVTEQFLSNVIYLKDSSVETNGLKIYGSPMSPKIGGWAFGYKRDGQAKRYWDNIPLDIDILVTHGPPEGILDKGYFGDIFGCRYLLAKIKELGIRGRLVASIHGHIHEARGIYRDHLGIQYVNASICNFPDMGDIRQPILIEVA